MQIDDVVWQVINHGHCSYKIKTETQSFCRNEYNLTGLCNRSSCPLANGNYATIIERQGVCYLNMKTVERSHMPSKLWEEIRLDKSYAKALEQIDEQIEFWPKFIVHKCKQRLTKLRQMINRIRKLKLNGMAEITPIKKKIERREKVREKKAEISANIETSIEQELLERLKEGTYGEIYNYNPKVFEKIMDNQEIEEEGEEEESVEGEDDEAFIYDPNEVDEDEEEEMNVNEQTNASIGDIEDTFGPSKSLTKKRPVKKDGKKFGEIIKKKAKPSVEVELEHEDYEQDIQHA